MKDYKYELGELLIDTIMQSGGKIITTSQRISDICNECINHYLNERIRNTKTNT